MKKKSIVFFALFIGNLFVYAQRHEVGIQLGASNLVGDVGKTNYINPFPYNFNDIANSGIPFYASFMYRLNFNPYQSVRFSLGYNHVQFNDKYAQELYRVKRGYYGGNSMYEASILFDYNFFPVNNEQKGLLSPYIFGGLSGIVFSSQQAVLYNDFMRNASGMAQAPTSSTDFNTTVSYTSKKNKFSMAIPFGVGLKYKFNYNWAIFGEFMFRPTFTDGIDYSNLDGSDVKLTYNKEIPASTGSTKSLLQTDPYLTEAQKRADNYKNSTAIGNINSKDWVNTLSLGISYSFGRPPCYCD